jgi:hypothetical protein
VKVRPELVVRLPLEGEPQAWVLATSYEDASRLAVWLASSHALFDLAELALQIREELEREDVA